MLSSDDAEMVKKARFLASQSREAKIYYEHKQVGYNYRMSNIVTGIGRGQLLHLDEHIKLKTNIYNIYKEAFQDIKEMTMNPYLEDSQPNFWVSCLLLDKDSKVIPMMIIDALAKEDIESRTILNPMHNQPVFEGCKFISAYDDSVSMDLYNRGVCLPSDIKNTEADMGKIILIVKGVLKLV